ncbi:hypothetical protein FA15DRAFT_667758 [Coprinopsis marcescibilis]|uniref:Alpha-type protein kinase domain-containing protein n=1 Tax=Coprinopsis marcescibilis TaxID=230819 RepID=A0A5C3K9B7_COPMA|nr:hypothetical protein FA15DRAFT_676664 [Coprinopsis marcescibilis]TFK26081.1 hypothetical protein FA15DRAFT_667758 [Coprinopsis marcescibilis]
MGEIENDSASTPDSAFTWPMEERHANSRVDRFSGTLQYTSVHSEISHPTTYAFAHFVLESTQHQIMFVDLQGTPILLRHAGER